MSIEKTNLYLSHPPQLVRLNRPGGHADTPVEAAEQPAEAGETPTLKTLERVAQNLDSYMKSMGRTIEFNVDKASGRTVITVRDSHTGELIRQIPSEEVLRLARRMDANSVLLSITA
jgi:flagellar protein FlaG